VTLFSAAFERRARVEGPYRLSDDGTVSIFSSGSNSSAGIFVDEVTAMTYTAVYSCVKVIAESIASLPLVLFQRSEDGESRKRATFHPLYSILHDQPNDEMSGMVWEETMLAHLLLWGNHYSLIERDGMNRISAILPLDPRFVDPERAVLASGKRGEILYRVRAHDQFRDAIYRAPEILHVPGLSFNGLKGMSVIAANRETVAAGMAAGMYGATFFGNSSIPSGILSIPGANAAAINKFRESWERQHQGANRANKTAVLPGDVKFTQISISPEDAQFIEVRKFQVEDVARMFRVPLVLLQSTEKSTTWGSGIEQLMIGFVTHTLRPWMVRIEQEISRKCLTEKERPTLYAEHLDAALLRGDLASRYAAYAVGRQWGWLSPNDVRRKENEDPIPGSEGDSYQMPANIAGSPSNSEPNAAPADPAPAKTDPATVAKKALGPILLDNMNLLVDREAKAIRNALEKRYRHDPESFLEWIDEFYGYFGSIVTERLAPAASAAGALFGDDRSGLLRSAAERFTATSKAELLLQIRRSADEKYDVATAIRALLDRWLENKARVAVEIELDHFAAQSAEELSHGIAA